MNIALSIGVNKYKTPGNDLRGCINDVINIRKTLIDYYDFSIMRVKTLLDKQATKTNIINALKSMIEKSNSGDHLVYHHSSHGSQIPDKDGDEQDNMDEILCTYDFDWEGTYISDDEMKDILKNLKPGVTMDIIIDACHSGTMLRNLNETSKFIPCPFSFSAKTVVSFLKEIGQENVSLISGCQSDQTSADAFIDNDYNGALTYYFCNELRKAEGEITRGLLIERIKRRLKNSYEQIPQLECSEEMKNRNIFT